MNTQYYYKNSTEFLEERLFLNKYSIRELRQMLKDYGWQYVMNTTRIDKNKLYNLWQYDYQEIPKVAMIRSDLYPKILQLNNGNDPYWVRKDSVTYMPEERDEVESTILLEKNGRINFAYLYSDLKKTEDDCPQSITVYSLRLSDFYPNGPHEQVSNWKTTASSPSTAMDWKAEQATLDKVIWL